jgi:hypothetical protein
MEEALILQQAMSNVQEYRAQWETLRTQDTGLAAILEAVATPKGKALVVSHDDPDGITSGLIFKRLLQKKGWTVEARFPVEFRLTDAQFDSLLAEHPDAKALFLCDKGTLAPYDAFAKRLPTYVIDHHPTPEAPKNVTTFNPSLKAYTWCSTSILAHGIATLAGTREPFDDFLCLVGLKGDWAIEPVKGILADFAKPFFVEYGKPFKNLLTICRERPTQFDPEQRSVTCLLSRITEFVHGTGGGGFQYFYHDRDPELKNVDHAGCIAQALEGVAAQAGALNGLTSLDGFVNLLPEPNRHLLQKIFAYFLEDWDRADRLLDSTTRAARFGETSVYLFTGGKVPLLPMIGSIKLFDLKQKAGDPIGQIIMVSSVSPEYTHVSVRGTGDRVHSGKFCGRLQDVLQARFPAVKERISGGGHPKAAECTIRTDQVSYLEVLEQVVKHLREMDDFTRQIGAGKAPADQVKRAQELGLEYLVG